MPVISRYLSWNYAKIGFRFGFHLYYISLFEGAGLWVGLRQDSPRALRSASSRASFSSRSDTYIIIRCVQLRKLKKIFSIYLSFKGDTEIRVRINIWWCFGIITMALCDSINSSSLSPSKRFRSRALKSKKAIRMTTLELCTACPNHIPQIQD